MKRSFWAILFCGAFMALPYTVSASALNADLEKQHTEATNCYKNLEVDKEVKNLYNEKAETIEVFNNNTGKPMYLTNKDIYLMAQVVYAESQAEPYEGKVAVASVILNRVMHPSYPKSIEGVIKQKNAFSCIRNGQIDVVPNSNCYKAVYDAIDGKDPTSKALFFYNPKIATSKWMNDIKKDNVKTIGNHVFFMAYDNN